MFIDCFTQFIKQQIGHLATEQSVDFFNLQKILLSTLCAIIVFCWLAALNPDEWMNGLAEEQQNYFFVITLYQQHSLVAQYKCIPMVLWYPLRTSMYVKLQSLILLNSVYVCHLPFV